MDSKKQTLELKYQLEGQEIQKIIIRNSFKELLDSAQGEYIGTGFPDANILIIGKECAIEKEEKIKDINGISQYDAEIENNTKVWKEILTNNSVHQIKNWIKCIPFDYNNYCPLYPYYGQKNNLNKERGTNRTWKKYQSLIDAIRSQSTSNDDVVNFHKYCFLSELSTATALKSSNADKEERKKSTNKRKELFNKDFFKDFKVIIVAAGHYPDRKMFSFDLQHLFGDRPWIEVKDYNFDINGSNRYDKTILLNNAFINVHYNQNDGKLLIHTNQLSYQYVNQEVISAIAQIIKRFYSNL